MAHGKGNRTSGNKKRPNVGVRGKRSKVNSGPSMADVVRGEVPPNPEAEIEAKRSDLPTEQLPPDAAAIRRRRKPL